MNNDSENIAKIWKIVAWFLLSLSLLVSSLLLILIFEIWDPEPLRPLKDFIPPIYKQIIETIAIIALLAISVSLLSFLIQIYMNKDPEKVAEIWKIVARPVHWVFRLAARFLLLAIRSAILILLLILLVIFTASFKVFDSALSQVFDSFLSETFAKNPGSLVFPIIMIIFVVIPIVLIPYWFQRHAKDTWESLLNTKEKIIKTLRGRWRTGRNIKKSLSVTEQHYSGKIRPSAVEMRTEFRKLFRAVSILGIVLAVYALVGNKLADPQTPSDIPLHLHPDLEEKLANHPHSDINDHSHKPSTSYRFKKGTVFSLVYEEGDLTTKKGICPEDSNQVEWLRVFKAEILDGFKDKEERLKLKVQGFASIAPVPVNGMIDDKQSNSLNRQIANERAEAVIYFLTLTDSKYDQDSCVAVLDSKKYAKDITWTGTNFDVSYRRWKSYDEMNNKKPVKNPQEEEGRQLDREFLNRSVHIIIEGDSDRTETRPAPTAEDNTG